MASPNRTAGPVPPSQSTIDYASPAASGERRGGVFRQLGVDTIYSVFGMPLAVVGFSLCLTLMVAGLGLSITFIGLPIMAIAIDLTRGFADLHRWNLQSVLGRRVARPRYLTAVPGSGWVRRMLRPLRDPQSWLDFAAVLIDLPLSIVAFVFTVVWWSGTVAGITSAAYEWAIPYGPNNHSLAYLIGLHETYANRVLVQTGIGLIMLFTLIPVTRMSALLRAYPALGLLSGIAEMRQEIVGLQERNVDLADQKQAAAAAETSALRRIERDIHDGPQQRLVRVAMDLGRVRQQLDTDPDAARTTIDEILGQTRETLDELRALSRGIAPPVLTDRGLAAALAALAGRSPVPIDLRLPADLGRLDPNTETTVYFVVAEALTNVAKHSNADVGAVRVDLDPGTVAASIADNGVGGASISKGHGLAGLADRVRAAGGTLDVTSPAGGPTEIRVVLPCG
ncbi:MAG TPA: sensor domain-containing protein [Micromonosporaceae bacterium]|nr:sensor domain-containing protein [Micromonosporaceae bacterium]